MNLQRKFPSAPVFFGVMFVLTSITGSSAAIAVYDPRLNTLPEAQGFTLSEGPPLSPPPSVSNGIFHQGPTSLGGEQFYHRNDVLLNLTNGFTLEATLKVISSTYDPNAGGIGSQRSGWYMEGIDQFGRRFIVGIDSSGVTVNTDAKLLASNGFSVRPFDTAGNFHHYRLLVREGVGTLFIDGTSVGSTPVGDIVDPATSNRVFFGDGTSAGSNEVELAFFRYTDAALPDPPQLTIARESNAVLLSWPSSSTNFILQATFSLAAPGVWDAVTNAVQLSGNSFTVETPIEGAQRFFRLQWSVP